MTARTFFWACGSAAVALTAATAAQAADVVAWDRTNEPGVAGYRVDFGPYPGNYTNAVDVGNNTTARMTGFRPSNGTWYVLVPVTQVD